MDRAGENSSSCGQWQCQDWSQELVGLSHGDDVQSLMHRAGKDRKPRNVSPLERQEEISNP